MPLPTLLARLRRLWTHDIWAAGLTRDRSLQSRGYAFLRVVSITLSGLHEMHVAIRAELRAMMGERGGAVPILYGGSVNRSNVDALLAADEVDGVLVGGASLDAEQWLAIVRSA